MSKLELYLKEFASIAPEYFKKNNFIIETHNWYKDFFKKEKLKKYEWKDFQALGEHIHAFNSNSLAKANAFGRENYPVEEYRKSFNYLAHGEGDVLDRMRQFKSDKVSYTDDLLSPNHQLLRHRFSMVFDREGYSPDFSSE